MEQVSFAGGLSEDLVDLVARRCGRKLDRGARAYFMGHESEDPLERQPRTRSCFSTGFNNSGQALAVFGDQSSFAVRNYPLEFTLVPIIVWAAYRFGQRETATITLVLSGMAIVGTLQGFGPFAQLRPNKSLLLLQSFMITVAITGLGLAAFVSERREVEAELKETNQKLKLSLDELEEYNHKMILHNEMGGLLQSCATFEEAYTIIGQLGQQLLPEETGVLYIR